MATRPQVEANSLSAINSLAANPPQYPHHPDVRESLTLYISRVPGTRDVILSTFRPQKKNVTVEDVANSLYYIHLDLETDQLLVAPQRPDDTVSPRSSSESSRQVIHRKPLPSSARVPSLEKSALDGSMPPPPPPHGTALRPTTADANAGPAPMLQPFQPIDVSYDEYRPNPMFHSRKSSAASTEVPPLPPRPATNFPTPSAPQPTRKSLGPRPQSFQGSMDGGLSTSPRERPVTPTYLGPRPAHLKSPSYSAPLSRTASPTKIGKPPSVYPFSLTLIRRDPASGNQWNVGKISSFQTNIPTPDKADPNLDPSDMGSMASAQKVDIHLETSGYAKYRNMPTLASVEASHPTTAQSFTESYRGRGSAPPTENPPLTATRSTPPAPSYYLTEEGFHRQVMMAYTKSWKFNFKEAFRRPKSPEDGSTSPEATLFQPPRKSFHHRHGSTSTTGSTESDPRDRSWEGLQQQQESLITTPGPGLKPKGFFFLSPWDGLCEFRTSSNGRSLKCRHILSDGGKNSNSSLPKFDPVGMAQNVRRDAQLSANAGAARPRGDSLTSALLGARNVSELRFNLPSGDILHSTRRRDGGEGAGGHKSLHAGFSKLLRIDHHHHSHGGGDGRDSDEDDWEEDGDDYDGAGMDLSLGREKAGGGNRGKRAKLGKLIIHDEGLKMLDLVVAANMGVWWTAWEKKF